MFQDALHDQLASWLLACIPYGHPDSAHDAFLKAAACYGKAYHPLYGAPTDPRLLLGALALDAPAGMRLDIPYEDGMMPALA